MQRQCARCGKVFETDTARRKYCGKECWRLSLIGKTRTDLMKRVTRKCVVCGKEFETGGRAGDISKQFCSTECRRAGRYRNGTPAKQLSDVDAAYIAGFVDGEGSIMAYLTGKNVVGTKLSIANNNHSVLEWLVEVTGVGHINNQPRYSDRHNASFLWICTGDSAVSIFAQIRAFLKIKSVQADLAIEIQKRLHIPALKADRTWQVDYYKQMKALNKRGKPV